jgi:mannose-6-phosphate isomerase-like protein (cupin superfamily)
LVAAGATAGTDLGGTHMGSTTASLPPAAEILRLMSDAYTAKAPPDHEIKINIVIRPGPESAGVSTEWYLVSSAGQMEYGPGLLEAPDSTLAMTYETLGKLYTGEWTGLTAAGRAHIRDAAPVEFTLPPGVSPLDAMRRGYFFITHFFSAEVPTRLRFGPGHTRKIHGANAAALFYATGLRSAYYRVTPEDKLNEDGARDPMHQAFIVIGGKGMATIGERRFAIEAGEAIYIPPDTVHMLETGGPDALEIIWLAWGDRA